MANLTITKVTDGYFDFNDDADNNYGGNNITYWYDAVNIYFKVDERVYTYTFEEVSYDDGVTTETYESTIEVITALKTAGFTGNFNSGGATPQETATIPSASALNIGTNTFINVTGTTTINSISSTSEGTIVRLKFASALTLTASSNIILPLTNDVLTATNDVAEFVSQGSGVYRLLSYTKADESYTNYTPTLTGCSTPPPIATGLARYKMLSPNVCQVIISPSTTGTSNATTKTITLPFPASSTSVQYIACVGRDNNIDTGMAIRTRVGSNIADIFKVFIGAHTSSGSWSVCVSGTYEID